MPHVRHLYSDAAVVCARPLVSGAAIGAEGQLTVYGYRGPLRTRTAHVAWSSVAAASSSSSSSDVAGIDRETNIPADASATPPPLLGPCYRCLFPQPPPAETVASCSNAGVLGPVPGIIGCMQALEVLKLAGSSDDGIGGSSGTSLGQPLVRRMLLLDGLAGTTRTVRLRDSQGAACAACANDGRLTRATIAAFAYSQFCGGAAANDKPGGEVAVGGGESSAPSHMVPIQQVAPREFARILQRSIGNAGTQSDVGGNSPPCRHVLLDVRDVTQFGICALPRSINVPLTSLRASWATLEAPIVSAAGASRVDAGGSSAGGRAIGLIAADDSVAVYLVCRRGRQSLKAARVLVDECGVRVDRVFNVRGGLAAWSREVDTAFPSY